MSAFLEFTDEELNAQDEAELLVHQNEHITIIVGCVLCEDEARWHEDDEPELEDLERMAGCFGPAINNQPWVASSVQTTVDNTSADFVEVM